MADKSKLSNAGMLSSTTTSEPPKDATNQHSTEQPAESVNQAETAPSALKGESGQPASTTNDVNTKPVAATTSDGWPTLPDTHPLAKFLAELKSTIEKVDYDEAYGITLNPSGDFHTKLILQKFLRANQNDLARAKDQLTATLQWRKEFQPLKAKEEVFSKEKFGALGYVTTLEGVPDSVNKTDAATFNIYGAVKDNKKTFGDTDEFIRWRVALMELGLSKLNLYSATTPIPDFGQGPDPYQGIQVHDYLRVSFLRQDPLVKAASKKTIDLFGRVYPETLSRKFFVNVPVVMGWMFTAMKMVLSKETVKKFTVLSYGNQLSGELGQSVPKVYGGSGPGLEASGETPKYE
ncbi:Non-classical phosphatidylinositol transfer protein (PITP) [Coniosporium uncinatum]|uniref:Non-classical phosphatidylinositol transfer protein (PITP) n=1 Tax=Coniosporium uncinatum TaxID=93489 RepID=A0ACC3DX61_9PEZI|nr:Non-classical phosphatidylinositol transfer protein (PITP) [Coniosporium uncinatum]